MDKYQILSNVVENEKISSLLKLWDNSAEHQFVPGLFSNRFCEFMNPKELGIHWTNYHQINNAYQKIFVLDMPEQGINDLNKIIDCEVPFEELREASEKYFSRQYRYDLSDYFKLKDDARSNASHAIFLVHLIKMFYFSLIDQIENAINEINYALSWKFAEKYIAYWLMGSYLCLADRIIGRDVSASMLYFYKGYLYEHLKQWKEAYNCYGYVIEKFPYVPMYFWHYGMMVHQLGDKQNADKNLQRAIKLYKNYISNSQQTREKQFLEQLEIAYSQYSDYSESLINDKNAPNENTSIETAIAQDTASSGAVDKLDRTNDALKNNSQQSDNDTDSQYSDDSELLVNDKTEKKQNGNTNIEKAITQEPASTSASCKSDETNDALKEKTQQSADSTEIKRDKIVSARVVEKRGNEIFLDFGNMMAFMPKAELGEVWDCIKIGDNLEVILEQKEDGVAPCVKLVKIAKEKQVSSQKNNEKIDKTNNEDKTLALNYINLGNYQKEQGKYEEAIQAYDKAIELDPTNYYAYVKRAEVKKLLNKREEALADIEQAMFLNPQYDRAYSFRGDLMKDMGNIEDAVLDYGKAIEFNPVRAYAYAYARRGLLLIKQQKYDMGIDSLKSAMLFAPEWKRGIIQELQKEQGNNPEISKIIDLIEAPNGGCNGDDMTHGNQEIDLTEKQKDKSISSDNSTEDYF